MEPELVEQDFEEEQPSLQANSVSILPTVEAESFVHGLEYHLPPPPPEQTSGRLIFCSSLQLVWKLMEDLCEFLNSWSLSASLMLAWCLQNNMSPDYERWVLGVEFCGSEVLSDRVHSYVRHYRRQCEHMERDILKHFNLNKQV